MGFQTVALMHALHKRIPPAIHTISTTLGTFRSCLFFSYALNFSEIVALVLSGFFTFCCTGLIVLNAGGVGSLSSE